MPFIFSSGDTQGSCFHYLENEDNKRVEIFLTKPIGKIVNGTLALQVFDDRDYMRITFADSKNLLKAAVHDTLDYIGIARSADIIKSVLKAGKIVSRNELCHFDFSQDEIKSGVKLIRFECMASEFGMIYLMCYDFNTYLGCAYCFPSIEIARGWGKALGIKKAYLYDTEDKFHSMVDL